MHLGGGNTSALQAAAAAGGGNIILEVDKSAGGTSPGILKPQFLSKDAEDNIDTILENLRRDSLI